MDWTAFELSDLRAERAAAGEPYLSFLEVPTLSTGLYEIPAGGVDRQQPHTRDEVYHVLAGRARFEVGAERAAVGPGSTLFVRAGVPHRFVEIEEDLSIVVFFAGPAT